MYIHVYLYINIYVQMNTYILFYFDLFQTKCSDLVRLV